jgi:hypothetical protein
VLLGREKGAHGRPLGNCFFTCFSPVVYRHQPTATTQKGPSKLCRLSSRHHQAEASYESPAPPTDQSKTNSGHTLRVSDIPVTIALGLV